MNYRRYKLLIIITLITLSMIFIFMRCCSEYREGLDNLAVIGTQTGIENMNDIEKKFTPKDLTLFTDETEEIPTFVPNHKLIFKIEIDKMKKEITDKKQKEFRDKIEKLKKQIKEKKDTIIYLETKRNSVISQLKTVTDQLF